MSLENKELQPATNEDVKGIIDDIYKEMEKEIENMPPTDEEIEYMKAKTDEERRKVFLKYNPSYAN